MFLVGLIGLFLGTTAAYLVGVLLVVLLLCPLPGDAGHDRRLRLRRLRRRRLRRRRRPGDSGSGETSR